MEKIICLALFLIMTVSASAEACVDDSDCDPDYKYCESDELVSVDYSCNGGECVSSVIHKLCFHEDKSPHCDNDMAYTHYAYCDSENLVCATGIGWTEDCNQYDNKYCTSSDLIIIDGYCSGGCKTSTTSQNCVDETNNYYRCDEDLLYLSEGYCDSNELACKDHIIWSQDCNLQDEVYCSGDNQVIVDGYCDSNESLCATNTTNVVCASKQDYCDGDSIMSYTGTCTGDTCDVVVDCDTGCGAECSTNDDCGEGLVCNNCLCITPPVVIPSIQMLLLRSE